MHVVLLARQADEDIEAALEKAQATLSVAPHTGIPVERKWRLPLRRLPLGRTRYSLFYEVDDANQTVTVLRLWHASRGRGPNLG